MQNWNKISPAQITRTKNGTDMSVFKNTKGTFDATVMDIRLMLLLDMEDLTARGNFKTQRQAVEFCEQLALKIEAAE